VVVVGATVVVVVVDAGGLAVTCIKYSNCLDICQSKLSVVLQPICLDGIAILLFLVCFT
jgi:hypothetical protein